MDKQVQGSPGYKSHRLESRRPVIYPQVAQTVKNLPVMWETQLQSLGGKDPLEKKMATHASILAWRIPGTEEPGGLQSTGSHRVRHDRATEHFQFHETSAVPSSSCKPVPAPAQELGEDTQEIHLEGTPSELVHLCP